MYINPNTRLSWGKDPIAFTYQSDIILTSRKDTMPEADLINRFPNWAKIFPFLALTLTLFAAWIGIDHDRPALTVFAVTLFSIL